MSSSPRARTPWLLLLLSPLCGLLAVALAWKVLFWDAPTWSWDHVTSTLLDSLSLVLLSQPASAPEDSLTFSVARILAMLAFLSGASGVALELSRPVRDRLRLLNFGRKRFVGRVRAFLRGGSAREPATVIGLGWIGQPLASELLAEGRPVFGVTLDEDSPRAIRAYEEGVFVVSGDASNDPSVLDRARVDRAEDIFIATGSDTRNIDVAGKILERLSDGGPPEVRCHVHVEDPALSSNVRDHRFLQDSAGRVEFQLFSNPDLTARDLFFHERHGVVDYFLREYLDSGAEEVFHMFVFGFGRVGQAISLAVARYAHFPSSLRPRLTVLEDLARPEGQALVDRFLDRHPAFAPDGLELTRKRFQTGDRWSERAGRPRPSPYQTAELGRATGVTPVEYAVNAEFQALPSNQIDAPETLDLIQERLDLHVDHPVRSAAVICFDEEWQSFDAALRLQQALGARFIQEGGPQGELRARAELPIYVYLPVEQGFSRLITNRARRVRDDGSKMTFEVLRESVFPLKAFGEQENVNSVDWVTGGALQDYAAGIRAAHAVLRQRAVYTHPDFASSDFDAALHALEIKTRILGIEFLAESERASAMDETELLLADLWGGEVTEAHRRLEDRIEKIDGRLALTLEQFESMDFPDGPHLRHPDLKEALRKRLVLLDRVSDKGDPPREAALKEAKARVALRVVEEFGSMLRSDGDADLAARMEHNRWMGERLAKGWRFGPRSDVKKQRGTLVPWDDLHEGGAPSDIDDDERQYDRMQLPQIVLERAELGSLYPVIRRAAGGEATRVRGPSDGQPAAATAVPRTP